MKLSCSGFRGRKGSEKLQGRNTAFREYDPFRLCLIGVALGHGSPSISREQKRHIKLLHIKLFPAPRSPVLPVGYPDKRIYVPWVPRTVHKTSTPGLPVGRPPGHRRGHRPKRFMFMCLFLS